MTNTGKRPADYVKCRPEVFDATDGNRRTEAIASCRRCPKLARCQAWVASLRDSAVSGLVAGELRKWVSHPTLRRRRAVSGDVST
jgi:hypothetical protein